MMNKYERLENIFRVKKNVFIKRNGDVIVNDKCFNIYSGLYNDNSSNDVICFVCERNYPFLDIWWRRSFHLEYPQCQYCRAQNRLLCMYCFQPRDMCAQKNILIHQILSQYFPKVLIKLIFQYCHQCIHAYNQK